MDNSTAALPDAPACQCDFDHLKGDIGQVRGDVSRLASDAVRAARIGAHEARERLDRRAHTIALRGRQSVRAVEHQVSAHPFVTVGGAFGVGLLAGLILSRRH